VRIGREAAGRLDRYLGEAPGMSLRTGPSCGSGLTARPGTTEWHRFRHHFKPCLARAWGAEGELVELNGWVSAQMLTRCRASGRGVRCRRSYDRRYGRPWSPHASAEGGVQNRSI
jgi:hypothetical protein